MTHLVVKWALLPQACWRFHLRTPSWTSKRVENHTVKVRKELGGGRYAEVELTLPALLCVQTGIQPLTFVPPARRIRARQQPVASFSVADLGLQAEQLVTQGYRFVGVGPPERAHQVELLQGSPQEIACCIAP